MAEGKPTQRLPADVVFRLSRVLALRREEEGSFLNLAKRINEANGNPRPMVIDRRKLVRIIEGDASVKLSPLELLALDRYLEPFSEGLAQRPILERPSILETLVERGKVTFLLGARPQEYRVDHSNWDVQAMAEILRGTGGLHRVHFDIREVLLIEKIRQFRKAYPRNPRPARGTWQALLGRDGPSLVCCGSPRSCHAAEMMLAEMFGVLPFQWAGACHPTMPFHFVWGSRDTSEIPGRFSLTGEDLKSVNGALAKDVMSGRSYVLLVGDEVYLSESPGAASRSESYGIVAAQRRPGSQVWMVIAGLTGSATHAAARCVKEIRSNLPRGGKGNRQSKVYWAVVKSTMGPSGSKRLPRVPRVTGQEIIGDLRQYP